MTRSRAMTWIGCATLALIVTGQMASSQSLKPDAHGFLIAAPEDMKAPRREVRHHRGRSEQARHLRQRITWAPGTGSRPHYHNEARYITVLKGTWYVATGPDADVYNPAK